MFNRGVRDIDGIFKMMTTTDAEHMRADTFYTKEPETVFWYHCMDKTTPIVDVGANVGVYALYAAGLNRKRNIYAFEPMQQNYNRLCQNIRLNEFDNVSAFNVALAHENGLDNFYIPDGEVGASGGQIKEPVNDIGEIFTPVATQDVLTMRLSRFLAYLDNPEFYLKIDVDGHELEVLEGLTDQTGYKIKSCLVEVNQETTDMGILVALMGAWGLRPDRKFNEFRPHSSERRGGNPVNVVFSRRK
jgi:FkbM family methyltransferase